MLVEPRRFGGGGERRGGDATLGRMTDWAALRTTAHQMTARSYAPYSNFQVGAAALEIHWTRISPRWTLQNLYGHPVLHNVTPELRTRGRAAGPARAVQF